MNRRWPSPSRFRWRPAGRASIDDDVQVGEFVGDPSGRPLVLTPPRLDLPDHLGRRRGRAVARRRGPVLETGFAVPSPPVVPLGRARPRDADLGRDVSDRSGLTSGDQAASALCAELGVAMRHERVRPRRWRVSRRGLTIAVGLAQFPDGVASGFVQDCAGPRGGGGLAVEVGAVGFCCSSRTPPGRGRRRPVSRLLGVHQNTADTWRHIAGLDNTCAAVLTRR